MGPGHGIAVPLRCCGLSLSDFRVWEDRSDRYIYPRTRSTRLGASISVNNRIAR